MKDQIKEKNAEIDSISEQNIKLTERVEELTDKKLELTNKSNEKIDIIDLQTKLAYDPIIRMEPQQAEVIDFDGDINEIDEN